MDEKRWQEILASHVGEDRGILEQYCVELITEVRRLRALTAELKAEFGSITSNARRHERERCIEYVDSLKHVPGIPCECEGCRAIARAVRTLQMLGNGP